MSVLDVISGASNKVNFGSAALSLVGMGAALFKTKESLPGIDGFLFDIPLNENVSYSAQITDHFTEDNSTIQDHVGIEPLKITLTGKIAELVYKKSEALAFLSAVIDRLTPLGVLSPEQAAKGQAAIASANQVISAAQTARKAFNSLTDIFSNEPYKNAQQRAYNVFEMLFLGRSIITVETPWKTFDSMIIESFTADQSEESTLETTFTVSFKQMRFVGTQVNTGRITGRIEQQKADVKKAGTERGGSTAVGLLDMAKNAGKP